MTPSHRPHLHGPILVDLGDDPVRPSETATVFGPGDAGEPTLSDWAGWADTIGHELVTRLGPRLRRHVLPPTTPTRTGA